MKKKNLIVIGSLLALLLGAIFWLLNALYAPNYTLMPSEPEIYQEPIQSSRENYEPIEFSIGKEDYILSPQADYDISAIVVSKRRYVKGFMHRLSPWDYGLAWGDMPKYLPNIKFRQMVRFLIFRYKPGANIDVDYVNKHVANTHLIPATQNIRRALKRAKIHDKVRLEGYLVNVKAQRKGELTGSWQSSLSRDDTGNGACELMYITSLQIGKKRYQ